MEQPKITLNKPVKEPVALDIPADAIADVLTPELLAQLQSAIPDKKAVEKQQKQSVDDANKLIEAVNRIADNIEKNTAEIHGLNSVLHKLDNIIVQTALKNGVTKLIKKK